jgi:hypothetical protein
MINGGNAQLPTIRQIDGERREWLSLDQFANACNHTPVSYAQPMEAQAANVQSPRPASDQAVERRITRKVERNPPAPVRCSAVGDSSAPIVLPRLSPAIVLGLFFFRSHVFATQR